MKVIGIISEYNPFHNGHKYQIEKSKQELGADYTVCVMSGNYIQRGEPAIIDKWSRARAALLNGIDLVIELPSSYVLQSAEFFAYGGVKLLDSLRVVDYISFGSESGNISDFLTVGNILHNEPKELSKDIKRFSDFGFSFPVSREKAIYKYISNNGIKLSDNEFIKKPNNILGVEYIKALLKLKSNIRPFTLKRFKSDYNSTDFKDNIASATAIRKSILEKKIERLINVMPESSFSILKKEILNKSFIASSEAFKTSIFTLITRMSADEISLYPEVSEGLENRIKNSINQCCTLEEFIDSIKTKRYTRTRIQRILFNILLGIEKNNLRLFNSYGGPNYIRILGMNDKGKKLLKKAKEKAKLPVITKPASYNDLNNDILSDMIKIDFIGTDIYFLHMNKSMINIDYKTSPIIL